MCIASAGESPLTCSSRLPLQLLVDGRDDLIQSVFTGLEMMYFCPSTSFSVESAVAVLMTATESERCLLGPLLAASHVELLTTLVQEAFSLASIQVSHRAARPPPASFASDACRFAVPGDAAGAAVPAPARRPAPLPRPGAVALGLVDDAGGGRRGCAGGAAAAPPLDGAVLGRVAAGGRAEIGRAHV